MNPLLKPNEADFSVFRQRLRRMAKDPEAAKIFLTSAACSRVMLSELAALQKENQRLKARLKTLGPTDN